MKPQHDESIATFLARGGEIQRYDMGECGACPKCGAKMDAGNPPTPNNRKAIWCARCVGDRSRAVVRANVEAEP